MATGRLFPHRTGRAHIVDRRTLGAELVAEAERLHPRAITFHFDASLEARARHSKWGSASPVSRACLSSSRTLWTASRMVQAGRAGTRRLCAPAHSRRIPAFGTQSDLGCRADCPAGCRHVVHLCLWLHVGDAALQAAPPGAPRLLHAVPGAPPASPRQGKGRVTRACASTSPGSARSCSAAALHAGRATYRKTRWTGVEHGAGRKKCVQRLHLPFEAMASSQKLLG